MIGTGHLACFDGCTPSVETENTILSYEISWENEHTDTPASDTHVSHTPSANVTGVTSLKVAGGIESDVVRGQSIHSTPCSGGCSHTEEAL
jgi:hypothetical protein